jgi:hypothetical protein
MVGFPGVIAIYSEHIKTYRNKKYDVEPEWEACSRGLDEALAFADRVRTEGVQPEGFEGLIGLIGDLLAPLDAFERASTRFRELRG